MNEKSTELEKWLGISSLPPVSQSWDRDFTAKAEDSHDFRLRWQIHQHGDDKLWTFTMTQLNREGKAIPVSFDLECNQLDRVSESYPKESRRFVQLPRLFVPFLTNALRKELGLIPYRDKDEESYERIVFDSSLEPHPPNHPLPYVHLLHNEKVYSGSALNSSVYCYQSCSVYFAYEAKGFLTADCSWDTSAD